jgi:segregation and condensation protein B
MREAPQVEQAVLEVEGSVLGPPALIESLLFVAAEPVALRDLARALELPMDAIEAALDGLAAELRGRGIRLLRHHDHVQLTSAPEAAAAIERFTGAQQSATRLSNAALETLAIVAYRQPITRPGIEAIRGVDSSGAVRTLMQRGLVVEVGRLPNVGRPVLYGTSEEFLKQFGLASLEDLPPVDFPDPPDVRSTAESSPDDAPASNGAAAPSDDDS